MYVPTRPNQTPHTTNPPKTPHKTYQTNPNETDEGKPLPFPPEPGNLGEILAMVLAVSPLQRDRYVRTLLDKVGVGVGIHYIVLYL